jgi:hypothetical protein
MTKPKALGKRVRGRKQEDARGPDPTAKKREQMLAYLNTVSPEMYGNYRIPSLKLCGEEGNWHFQVRLF